MEYRATYKCRLCGKTYESGTTCTQYKIAERALVDENMIQRPEINILHLCDKNERGRLGIADFIGWDIVQKREDKKDGSKDISAVSDENE